MSASAVVQPRKTHAAARRRDSKLPAGIARDRGPTQPAHPTRRVVAGIGLEDGSGASGTAARSQPLQVQLAVVKGKRRAVRGSLAEQVGCNAPERPTTQA